MNRQIATAQTSSRMIDWAAKGLWFARETMFRTEAMSSRIAQLAVVDALIACLALATYDDAVSTLQKTADVLSIKRL
ncbi:hypothetical protein [Mesorhizobium sp.]|uniref:hypothetical protein n=1 Tax=Mesorhizobium sp. TaxID=1871066 RepID=UPI0025FC552F|nr:hypothetical protein [Mesorhizobium sp.]